MFLKISIKILLPAFTLLVVFAVFSFSASALFKITFARQVFLLLVILFGSFVFALSLARTAWWFYWWSMERWTESVRIALHSQKITSHAELYVHSLALSRRARKFTDLDGSTIRIAEDQIKFFRVRCCQELCIQPAASWSIIRQHWRRNSLYWHPDHGGSIDVWLRKQRAYQVLEELDASPNQPIS